MGNPYRIGVEFMMDGNLRHRLGIMIADMGRMLMLQNRINNSLDEGGRLARGLWGVGGVMLGTAGIREFGKLIDKGNEWVRVSRNMAQAGVASTQVFEAQAKALALSQKYMNLSSTAILGLTSDARGILGDQAAATGHIDPIVASASFLRAYQGHELGGHNSESLFRELNAALKSSEIAGKITPDEMSKHIRELTAMKVAFGDQLKIAQYLTAQRTAGVALRNTSDEFRYGMFPALVQENGVNAGTMLMTAFNKIVAGVGNRTLSIQRMAEIGLLSEDQVKYDKVGRAIGLKDPSAIRNNMEAAMNFGSWVMGTLKPLLDEKTKGFTDPRMRSIRESQLISGMFPDRNVAKAVTEILQQFKKLTKDGRLVADAYANMRENVTYMDHLKGRKSIGEYLKGSWDYQVQAFSAQWQTLMTSLGAPAVATATAALAKLNEAMGGMASWAMANPDGARRIAEGIGILGAALVGGGAVAIVAALGPAGWLPAVIIALAGVLAANRSTFKDWADRQKNTWSDAWKNLGEVMAGAKAKVTAAMTEIGQALIDGIGSLPGRVYGEISSAIGKIADFFNSQLSRLWEGLKNLSPISAPGGGVGGGAKKASWEPSGEGRATNVHNVIYLDGKVLARSTARHLSDSWRFPRSAPYHDGMRDYSDPGQQLVTT